MKIILRFTILLTAIPFISFGQTGSWPFSFSKPTCSTMGPSTNCTKWVVTNDGDWSAGSTWNGGTVPGHNDIVCIQANMTVKVNNPVYTNGGTACPVASTAATPTLHVFVCGTIDFKAGGKLYTGCGTTFTIYGGGSILAANGSSELINISPAGDVWGGQNNQTLVGPYYLTGTGQGSGVLSSILKDFRAELKKPFEVTLTWSTLQEYNNEVFVIERSTDNKNWQALSTIESKGNSTSLTNYSYFDKSVVAGLNFYRLKQVDKNGAAEYSTIIKITNRTNGKISIFPNPVRTVATVYSSTAFTGNQSVQVFSMNGALMKTIGVKAGNTIQLPVADLGAGVYFIRLTENGTTVSETKRVKQ
jgi:hypothetical protein